MYFRLPLQSQLPSSRPNSSHNRYPLTSPTVTPPSVCAQNSCATRRDSNSGDATKARALLSRVASSPVVPKLASSTPSSPVSTHSQRNEQEASGEPRHPGMVGAMERRYSDGYEAAKCWTGHQQRDGYISFPDYEKYFPNYPEDPQRQEIKT